jgi:3-deoxy-D-manno-octulosonic-acid transferase
MGVLRDFYAIATVVFVGRSIVDLGPRQHGSDMIEPAALGKACIVGPYTANFAEAMRKFQEAEAILVAPDEEALAQGVAVLLSTPQETMAMGMRAERVVKHEQGATMRHARVILQILQTKLSESGADASREPRPVREAVPVPQLPRPLASSGKVVITSIGAMPPQPPRDVSQTSRASQPE